MELTIKTKKKNEMIDITKLVKEAVEKSNIKDGICSIYTPHTTCAIVINENNDPNICTDILNYLTKAIPENIWLHDKIDNNAAAHIKATILGPEKIIPIKNKKILFGQWQSPMLVELDGPRERKIIITIK